MFFCRKIFNIFGLLFVLFEMYLKVVVFLLYGQQQISVILFRSRFLGSLKMIGSSIGSLVYFHLVSNVLMWSSWWPVGPSSRSWLDILVGSGMIELLPKTGWWDVERAAAPDSYIYIIFQAWWGYFRKRSAGILDWAPTWVSRFPYMTFFFGLSGEKWLLFSWSEKWREWNEVCKHQILSL